MDMEIIDYPTIHGFLTLAHHHEWHKPISLGRLTIVPQDRIVPRDKIGLIAPRWKEYKVWYPTLVKQQKFYEDPNNRRALCLRIGIEGIQKIKEAVNGSTL